MTFFLAALLKWSGGVTPSFLQQFGATWLARLPGGLPAVFYFLALLETIVVAGLLVSLLRREFFADRPKTVLKLSLIFSLFVLLVLSLGSRLTGKFDIAATNMLYFVGALLSFREAACDEP